MNIRLLASILAAYVAFAGIAVADTSLKDELSPQEFERAGLGKLSPEELSALNSLVRVDRGEASQSKRAGTSDEKRDSTFAVQGGEAGFGSEQKVVRQLDHKTPKEIRSKIVGAFKGWTGHTTFRLENGQVWRQTDGTEFSIKVNDPVIIIRKASLGSYRLRIEGYSTQTTVQRVD